MRKSLTSHKCGYPPYEEAHPSWQFAFVFNTNRCIGCQTCTMACKSTWTFARGQEQMWWNNVETKPYGGYPHAWDVKLLRMLDEADPGGQRWTAQSPGQSGAGAGGGNRLPVLLSVRFAPEHYPRLASADAPNRLFVPQEDRRNGLYLRFRH